MISGDSNMKDTIVESILSFYVNDFTKRKQTGNGKNVLSLYSQKGIAPKKNEQSIYLDQCPRLQSTASAVKFCQIKSISAEITIRRGETLPH